MTIEASLRRHLAANLAKHGENDFSTRQIRRQLERLVAAKAAKLSAGSQVQKFHLGARQGTPEDHPKANPLESREDMYGSVIPDDQEGESAGGGGGVSFALKPGKFQSAAKAKTPPSAAKLPSIPAHAGPGAEPPLVEQNGPQMAHSLLHWIAANVAIP